MNINPNRGWWVPAEDGGPEREYVWPYVNSELGLRLYFGGNQKEQQFHRIREFGSALIFIDSSVKNLSFLRDFPKSSVFIFHVSDETYSPAVTFRIMRSPSVVKIYRDYPIPKAQNLIYWPSTLASNFVRAIRTKISLFIFFKAILFGLVMAFRQILILSLGLIFRKKLGHFPLGYTNSFSTEYRKKFNLTKDSSLIDSALLEKKSQMQRKLNLKTFFSGQLGNFDRQLMISEARKIDIRIGTIYRKFAASDNLKEQQTAFTNYVNGIYECQFSLCPPGNYSQESFRYLESLLLWAIPVLKDSVVSDPMCGRSNFLGWDEFVRLSVTEALQQIDCDKILENALLNFKGSLEILSTEIKSKLI
jgi:hypothetical protein